MIDHVHIILDLKPTDRLSEAIQYLKGKSSFTVLKEFPFLIDLVGKSNLWSDGYSVDSLGRANVAQVKAYLNGVFLDNIYRLRVLFCKSVGISLAISAGVRTVSFFTQIIFTQMNQNYRIE